MTTFAKRAYPVDEVAEMYSVSESQIRNMVKRGELGIVPHMGRRVLVLASELERVFEQVAS